ncbi:MAG: SDR family NAD(P)-dependent oxidoreductase [Chloroflexi bacterium]|nr:MAG: SDR family NAD(P)-dependent oxidoreductase [Chloroflexota bacterium]
MHVLVTGGAGFIGSHLCEALLARGDEVVCLDNFDDYYDPARKRANVAAFATHPRCSLVEADVRDREGLAALFEQAGGFDAIAHLAAMAGVRASVRQAVLYTQVNVLGTVHLLDLARDYGVGNFVFASTSSVYGRTRRLPFVEDDAADRPLAPYPATKRACEMMGHAYHNMHGLNFTALRLFSVYGPRGRPDMMPYTIVHRLVHDQTIVLFEGGRMRRDWTYVDDIVRGVVAALDRPLGYEVINLGRGEPIWMDRFVRILEALVGKKARLETPPAPASEPPVTYADIGKARRLLDYHPTTSVEEGLARLWAWYRAEIGG